MAYKCEVYYNLKPITSRNDIKIENENDGESLKMQGSISFRVNLQVLSLDKKIVFDSRK